MTADSRDRTSDKRRARTERDQRLAEALRENLYRRKAQARSRTMAASRAGEPPSPPEPTGCEAEGAGLSGAGVSHKSNRND